MVRSFKRSAFFRKYKKQGLRIPNLSLKELRDEERPDRPCFQSVVAFDRELGRSAEAAVEQAEKVRLDPLSGRYTVTFNSTPSWPIVERLGLEHRSVRSDGGSPVAVCEVIEPFLIRADLRAQLAEDLLQRRIGAEQWAQSARQKSERGYLARARAENEAARKRRRGQASAKPPLLQDLLHDLYILRQRRLQGAARKAKKKTRARSRRAS